jgi:membrane protein YdbS with pleckstrin-like domain
MAVREKVIKPPMDEIARGKVFRPSRQFRNKMWFLGVFTAIMLWFLVLGSMVLVFFIVAVIEGGGAPFVIVQFNYWWLLVSFWYWVITAFWFVPYMIIYPIYLRAFEYSVIAKSGQAMPEIYTKKGIINITRKHVPFRTIVNVASRAGPFDRLFGIGTVEIETAGFSGAQSFSSGAEERLEGLTFYEELRDFILVELRKFKDPYVTGTEVVHPQEDVPLPAPGNIEDEILSVLREIRDLLRSGE